MGLLDHNSISYAIGQTLGELGAKVIYTVQNERMKSIFIDRNDHLTPEQKAALDVRFCDVTQEEQIKALFASLGPVDGVVHSIAYANPRTCLGAEFHTDAINDLLQGFHISCVSLASVVRYAAPHMPQGGGVVTLTFDTSRVYPSYNWMGVNKSALESLVRALARRHGKDRIRVNAVSAGPLHSKAASKIPGFSRIERIYKISSPLSWDVEADKLEVANAVAFLLGPYSKKITGQTLFVDGGASITAGRLMPWERPAAETPDAADVVEPVSSPGVQP